MQLEAKATLATAWRSCGCGSTGVYLPTNFSKEHRISLPCERWKGSAEEFCEQWAGLDHWIEFGRHWS
jgi:hypothetical protein